MAEIEYEDVEHMLPGTVAICSERLARYTDFSISLKSLIEPEGTKPMWAMSSSVPENHEMILRLFEGDFVWHLDDDMTFEQDTLARLLSHDVEAVVPLSTRRSPPLVPLAYWSGPEGYEPVNLNKVPDGDGLVSIDACGWGGLLLRRSAIDKLGDPPYLENEVMLAGPDVRYGSDIRFCEKLRWSGVDLWLDTNTRVGHIGQVTYSARQQDGQWGVVLDLDGGEIFVATPGGEDGEGGGNGGPGP